MGHRNALLTCVATLIALGTVPASAQSSPKLSYNLFGDLRYVAQDNSQGSDGVKGRSHSGLGQLVFMTQGSLDDHWSAFVEAVLEYNPDLKNTGVDLERFYIEYQASDAFTAGLGKRHAPMGYWNNAFHHGAVFQPTIDRPFLVAFEDGGGMQPAHDTGLWVRGRVGQAGWFGYDVMSSNGQTATQESDANSHKAITGRVEFQFLPVAVGLTYRADALAAFNDLNARPGMVTRDTDLTFTGADLRVEHPRVKLFAEYMQITEKDSQGEAKDSGWFAYVGFPLESWTPYAMVQGVTIDKASRAYADGFVETRRSQLVGLKYQFESTVVLKAEAQRTSYPNLNRTENKATVAVAFGF